MVRFIARENGGIRHSKGFKIWKRLEEHAASRSEYAWAQGHTYYSMQTRYCKIQNADAQVTRILQANPAWVGGRRGLLPNPEQSAACLQFEPSSPVAHRQDDAGQGEYRHDEQPNVDIGNVRWTTVEPALPRVQR